MIKKHFLLGLLAIGVGTTYVAQLGAKEEFNESRFQELLMEEAEDGDGVLELDLDLIRQLLKRAGMPAEQAENFNPRDLLDFFGKEGEGFGLMPGLMSLNEDDVDALERQYYELVDAHKPATIDAAKSTVAFYVGEDLVTMGTAISKDGKILTKASDYKRAGDRIRCEVGNKKRLASKLLKEFPEHDLALVQLQGEVSLQPITWYTGEFPEIGSFLAAPALPDQELLAIGVLSVQPRSLRETDRAFLGVGLESDERGVRVTRLVPESAAQKAGLEAGDVITSLNGNAYDSVADFINAVGVLNPGDEIKLKTLRNDKEQAYKIELGQRPRMGRVREERFDRMNNMGTRLSQSRAGYPDALQHDLPIDPEMCGGPVVDLDGNVLGINIARAGRVKTYAITASAIQTLLETEANTPPAREIAEKPAKTDEKKAKLERAVADAQKSLEKARKAAREAEQNLKKAESALKNHLK